MINVGLTQPLLNIPKNWHSDLHGQSILQTRRITHLMSAPHALIHLYIPMNQIYLYIYISILSRLP